jgi:hypothetical protein
MKSKFFILSLFISTLGLAQAIPPNTPTASQPAPTEPTPEKTEIKVCKTYDGSVYKVVRKDEECGPVKEAKEPPKEKPKPKPVPKPKPKPKPTPTAKKCPPCTPQIQIVEKEKIVEREKITYKKWRIYGGAGIGQNGMKSAPQIEGEQVDKYLGPIFGGGIDYHFNESWSIGAQGWSNESGMLIFGYSP